MTLLRIEEVCRRIGFGKTKIYEMIKENAFLPGYSDGKHRRWLEHEVEAFRILYWGLDEPMPAIRPEVLDLIHGYLAQNQSSHLVGDFVKKGVLHDKQ